ncbi:MAG: hypothetical protein WC438_00620 [Candidatus Pacearchaeota archaeon]
MEIELKNLVNAKGRIFIVPLDHPEGEDTKKLSKIGIQNFVNKINSLGHDGYIFHSRYYIKNPIKTNKDFFLTVGEQLEDYKLNIKKIEQMKEVRNLTIFFEVDGKEDKKPIEFYKEYIKKLKERGYIIMGMGYPSKKFKNPNYQIVANIAKEIGCDFFKTDYSDDLGRLNLYGMKLFIAGGPYLEEEQFKDFSKKVEKLKIASASFGRNIFEANKPEERINFVVNLFEKI